MLEFYFTLLLVIGVTMAVCTLGFIMFAMIRDIWRDNW